jgi:glycosyltransferase involved in cell wall biosynthesis
MPKPDAGPDAAASPSSFRSAQSEKSGRIGVVLKGYPRLSETFIAQEILELQRAGFDLEIISLRRPTDRGVHPVHREITAPVEYLPEYLHEEPLRVLAAWRRARRLPGYRAARAAFMADLRRDFTRNRIRRFGQGLVIAAEFAPRLAFLYAHFLHTPASAARYGAIMAGLRYAISAHAKDIWTTPDWEIREKLAECEWCVTCTQGGTDELRRHAQGAGKVELVYHGIDLSRFPTPRLRPPRDGADPADPIRLLTVGRAVAKKGIDTLLEALKLLPTDLHWRWTHIGGGPLRDQLRRHADRLNLSDRCEFSGGRPQEDVIEAYQQSDLFVLPCRIDATGDRDGLPNVIVEALALGLPVISTPVSGIVELVEDGENGRLVPPDRPEELASAIAELARDPDRRTEFGWVGERTVRAKFDHRKQIGALIEKLRRSLAKAEPVA